MDYEHLLSSKEHENNSFIKHFNSYRASIYRDLPPDFDASIAENLYEIKRPHMSCQEYLKMLGLNIYKAVEDASVDEYLAAITEHKSAFEDLLNQFVRYARDKKRIDIECMKSWGIFKFSQYGNMKITFTDDFPAKTIYVVPHYGNVKKELWAEGIPVFDADEMLLIGDITWENQKDFMASKVGVVEAKILALGEKPTSLRYINSPFEVRDWKLIGCAL